MSQLAVTLKKSRIGTVKKHQPTLDALGLRKVNQTKVFEDTPQIRGMIKQVEYLLDVREAD